MKIIKTFVSVVFLSAGMGGWLLTLAVVSASESSDSVAPQKPIAACQRLEPKRSNSESSNFHSANYRAFDFWLGSWIVTSPARPDWTARSEITLGNDGCSVHESYQTAGGYSGSSVNFFDQTKKQWVQTWIDNQGHGLFLVGHVKGDSMVMSDDKNRITWTPLPDGRVRQHWELLGSDKPKTVFDGYYRPVE